MFQAPNEILLQTMIEKHSNTHELDKNENQNETYECVSRKMDEKIQVDCI